MHRTYYYRANSIIAVVALMILFSGDLFAKWNYQVDGISSPRLPFHYIYLNDLQYPVSYEIMQHQDHLFLKSLEIEEIYHSLEGGEYPYGFGSVEKIGRNAFLGSQLEYASLPSSVRSVYNSAFRNSMLRDISFKSGLVFIDKFAFAGTKLEKVTLPESLRCINKSAFENIYSLTGISLPSTLESLGGFTFYGDIALNQIICNAKTPPMAEDSDFGFKAYYDIDNKPVNLGPDPEQCVLYVPSESIRLYRAANGWKGFRNIVAIGSSGVDELTPDVKEIDYIVENGVVTINGIPGDHVEIYSLNGLLLQQHRFESASSLRFEGTGIHIIRINDSPIKVML